MRGRIKEQGVLVISVIKWLVLATAVGTITGLSTTVFVESLNWGARAADFNYYYLLAPLGLFASAFIIEYLLPGAKGHGANYVIDAIHKKGGRMKALNIPVEFVRTWVTITAGGSAGKEGPSAQIGAGLSSILADLLKFQGSDRVKLVICGISGGFASVFGTPLAGAIFGIEVLFVGSIRYDVLLPSFVTGLISYQVSSWLGLTYFYNPIEFVPVFSEAFFLKVVIAGFFFGLVSFIYIESLRLGAKVSAGLKMHALVKAFVGGVALIIITLAFSTDYLGLGLEKLRDSLLGAETPWYAFLLKCLTTSITVNFGGHGGMGTPIFFVGATAGNSLAPWLGIDASMLAAIGFVSLLAGAANTPIAASIMAVELFGAQVAPYAALACVISFYITGHRSAYPSQVLAMKKSSSIEVELGEKLGDVKPEYVSREGGLITKVKGLLKDEGKGKKK